ncbi:tRNA (Uracil-5-)-methyltransferase [Toxoplasma gondii RUB]|uniref:tRNA (Uracil-5-)-methyltransferase n=1 Tax=Toxoplasma gondii RUB TaxID=935652 RepID=A0A086M5L0_TOXGO|nr:tRNA (Uracil-5-)-methyltransferase [Toxoplasma gondii RUB]
MSPRSSPKHGRSCHSNGTWRLVIIIIYSLVLNVLSSCSAFRLGSRYHFPTSGHLSARSLERLGVCNGTPPCSVIRDDTARKERRWSFKLPLRLIKSHQKTSRTPPQVVLYASLDGHNSAATPPAHDGTSIDNVKRDQYRPSDGDIVLVHIQFIIDTGEGFGSICFGGDRCVSDCGHPDHKAGCCDPQPSRSLESGLKQTEIATAFARHENPASPSSSSVADPPDDRNAPPQCQGKHGKPVFVPFSIPGEYVWVRIHKALAQHSIGFIVAYVNAPSPRRVTSPCPYFGACSGCQYQHMPLSMQHEVKRGHVQGVLCRLAGLPESATVNPVLSNNERGGYHYRSKITPHYTFYQAGSLPAVGYNDVRYPRRVLEIESCKLALRSVNEKLAEIRKQIAVQAQAVSPDAAKAWQKGATVLLRDTGLNSVTSDPGTLCASTGIDGLHCWYRAGDFFQVNRRVLPLLVSHVREQLRDLHEVPGQQPPHRRLLDCYCGVGLFALACHDDFDEVVGFDVCSSSIELAKYNAQFNSKWRARFEVSDAKNFFESFSAGHSSSDKSRLFVVLDPPRKGCDSEFLLSLLKLKPERIVYISCHPATQARDLKAVLPLYTVKNIQPFDMFPHTRHIECVITLERSTKQYTPEQPHGCPIPATHKIAKARKTEGIPSETHGWYTRT